MSIAHETRLMSTYKRLEVAFTRGQGPWLWDEHGNKYLDALSGIAVCGLGHAHARISAALREQASLLWHTSNLYGIPLQQELGHKLTRLAGLDKVFFCNSGAEANEAAIKLARLFGHGKGIARPEILVMEGSFHGRTLATLSATGNAKVQRGFEPLVEGFIRVPYADLTRLVNAKRQHPDAVAVLVEPIQGEGGIRVPAPEYLAGLRTLCDGEDMLLMVDEIQSGLCRTGTWFACAHSGVLPDVMTLAKSLGNGFPIGACLAGRRAADLFGPGSHGTTFGGNPLACRVALEVLRTLETEGLAAHAAQLGARLLEGFQRRLAGVAGVAEVRGKGLMIGIELTQPCSELVTMALRAGILINVTADNVIRLLPPLIITETEAELIVDKVVALIVEYFAMK